MNRSLILSTGRHSDAGRKLVNQDSFGCCIPAEPHLSQKGAAFAIADGISSSSVSQIASETAVKSFLDDYYCTSDAWSVRHAAEQVLKATNAWLLAQTMQGPYRFEKDKGYICTFSAAVLKSGEAHIFHLGDSRVYLLRENALQQLTHDHRLWAGENRSYLSRALGSEACFEIDYRRITLRAGDILLMTTDGVHEHLTHQQIVALLRSSQERPNKIAKALVEAAKLQGSSDNLTVQLVRVDHIAAAGIEVQQRAEELPLPPLPKARDEFDGYTIDRQLHASNRSHVYLATDRSSGACVVLKMPSIDLSDDPAYRERLMREEWIARRVDNPHVVRPGAATRPRNYLYTVTEYIEGRTLRQWMNDHTDPDLESVRNIVEQVAKGLQALHRAEILHQDLRPENILIDSAGTAILIDLGSARVDGIGESADNSRFNILGTALYSAPEYFLGDTGTSQSDLFSLAVLTYHLLSGQFPYGTLVPRCTTVASQHKLQYQSVLSDNREIPTWVDAALKKALQPNPLKRYEALSEFIYDLRHPNPAYLNRPRPLIDRQPVRFWQSVSATLLLAALYLLSLITTRG